MESTAGINTIAYLWWYLWRSITEYVNANLRLQLHLFRYLTNISGPQNLISSIPHLEGVLLTPKYCDHRLLILQSENIYIFGVGQYSHFHVLRDTGLW